MQPALASTHIIKTTVIRGIGVHCRPPPYHLRVSTVTPPIRDRVAKVINLIRPAVQSDGGDVELVDVTPEGIARIRLHGACVGCPSSSITLQVGIERNLKVHIPEIKGVEAVE